MASLRLLIALALATVLLALPPSAGAIVGGEPDADPAHDFVVFVGQASAPRNACSGLLVSGNRVVTAAHCGMRADGSTPAAQLFVVRRGPSFRSGFMQRVGLFYPHPSFSFGGNGRSHFATADLAVIRLMGPPLPPPYAQLPEKGYVDSLKGGSDADVIGYGVSEMHGNDPIVASFDGQRRIDHGRLLGGGVRNGFFTFLGGACFADSGGFVGDAETGLVYGIVSFAPSGCRSTTDAASLDTDEARDFLAANQIAVP